MTVFTTFTETDCTDRISPINNNFLSSIRSKIDYLLYNERTPLCHCWNHSRKYVDNLHDIWTNGIKRSAFIFCFKSIKYRKFVFVYEDMLMMYGCRLSWWQFMHDKAGSMATNTELLTAVNTPPIHLTSFVMGSVKDKIKWSRHLGVLVVCIWTLPNTNVQTPSITHLFDLAGLPRLVIVCDYLSFRTFQNVVNFTDAAQRLVFWARSLVHVMTPPGGGVLGGAC